MTNHNLAKRVQNHDSSIIAEILIESSDPNNTSFAGGYPDASLFPSEELTKAFNQAIGDNLPGVFQYTDSKGPDELRELVAKRHTSHMSYPTNKDHIIMTQGGQQALDLIAKLFLNPGDGVAVEGPTYLGVISVFENYAPRYYEIMSTETGIDIEELERQCQSNRGEDRIKLLYIVPDFQNPTGITISREKRQKLVDLAEKYDFYIIEDSPYRELRYHGEPVPTIQSFDTHERVLYVSSFSKILAPSLRLGYVCTSIEFVNQLAGLKSGNDIQSPNMTMDALTYYLKSNDIDAHIQGMLTHYSAKCDAMVAALRKYMPSEIKFTEPEGGFFLWLEGPEDLNFTKFLNEVLVPEAHIVYVPGQAQFVHGDRTNSCRLSFATVPVDKIDDGVQRLATSFKNYLAVVTN